MSRRSKETLAVQLFPFLAVLVCTMGSLIFLLLVTTRQVRQRALAFAAYQVAAQEMAQSESISAAIPIPAPEPETALPLVSIAAPVVDNESQRRTNEIVERHQQALAERERELDELKSRWQLRAGRLRNDRERLRQVVADSQSQTDQVDQQTETMKTELENLASTLEKLKSDASAASARASDDTERLAIEKQIAELKKRLRAAQAAQDTAANDQYQVVPFDPQTGTTRRPILIECTAEGIKFLPEGITITAADMQGFTPRMNPLAAGTGALVNYWNDWNSRQRNPRSEPEPYVLLLVRPDGAVAYYVAMRMLEPIRTAHGYELVDDETTLKLPPVDPAAKLACQTAVERLFAERDYVSRQAQNSGLGGTVFGGPGTRSSGGRRGNPGTMTGSSKDRSVDAGKTGDNVFTMTDVTGGSEEVGTRSWERIENFEGRPRHRKGTSQAEDTTEEGSSLSGSSGGLAEGTTSNTEQNGKESAIGGNRTASATNHLTNSPQSSSRVSSHAAQQPAKFGKQEGRSAEDFSSTDSTDELDGREPGMPIGRRPPKKNLSPNMVSDQTTNDLDESEANESAGASSNPNSKSSKGRRSDEQTGQHDISDNDSSSNRNPNGSKLSVLSSHERRRSSKSKSAPERQLDPEMLSGRHWGLADADASIGFEREVRVDVFEDRMVIAEKFEIPFGVDSRQETFEHFVSSLDKHSREWGRPPHGFYWSPRLKFIVKPEANGHYEQINALMLRAGLPTAHEFTQSTDTIEYGKDSRFIKLRPPKSASKTNAGGIR